MESHHPLFTDRFLTSVPRSEFVALLGSMPRRLTLAQFNAVNWWTTTQPADGYDNSFTRWRPELESWSPQLRMWGIEDSDRIDLSVTSGKVHRIEFRVDIRSINVRFIEVLCKFARDANCVLVSAHSLSVIEPLRSDLLLHLTRSPGANNVWDWLHGHSSLETNANRPMLFLSHSSSDKTFVSRLAVDLKSRQLPVWFDAWELKVGDSLWARIAEGITGSGWLAVVLSKNSVRSNWVSKELNAALSLELQSKNVFVLPILLEDCDIPLFLREKVYADFRSSYEDGFEALMGRVIESVEEV